MLTAVRELFSKGKYMADLYSLVYQSERLSAKDFRRSVSSALREKLFMTRFCQIKPEGHSYPLCSGTLRDII